MLGFFVCKKSYLWGYKPIEVMKIFSVSFVLACFLGLFPLHSGNRIRTSADIQKAIDDAVSTSAGGDVRVVLKGGTYLITEEIKVKGASNLVIEGEPGKEVLLKGDVDIKRWRKAPSGSFPKGVVVSDLRGIGDLGEVIGRENRIDLYADGRRQTVARWPDEGFTEAGRALGTHEVGDTWIHKHGTYDGLIEYVDARISSWVSEDDPRFHGYWYWDWCEDNSMRPETIDTVSRTIQFRKPLHVYGYRDNCRFYGFNLLSELDHEGEYYIHRSDSLIYWLPPSGVSARKAKARLSMFSGEYVFSFEDCRNVTLRNISIRGIRRSAISVKGGESVRVEACHLQDLGDVAINVDGGRGHTIAGNHIEEMGFGGIVARGGDRKTLDPSGFVISDNVIERFSLFKRTYQPAVHFTGIGLLITHNRFQWSSSSALRIEGNDVDITFNQIFNVVEESDDQGGLDCYFNVTYRRIRLINNHWRDIRGGLFAGAAAIRFDDMISGHEVSGNVFERCGDGIFGAVQINGGNNIYINDNLFYDCPWAVTGNDWALSYWQARYKEQVPKIRDVDADSEIWLDHYPELRNAYDADLGVNYVDRNLVVGAKAFSSGLPHLVCSGNHMVEMTDTRMEHYLQPDVLASYGVAPIPFEEIGPRR